MKLESLISDTMLRQNQALHADASYGRSGWHHTLAITLFAQRLGARSILDYGCGRSTLRKSMEDWEDFRQYDPAIEKHSVFPEPADLVVCTDVLEHVERSKLSNVRDHLCTLSIKGCFAVAATRESNKLFPDGTNTHLIIKPPKWWIRKMARPGWGLERHQNVLRKDGSLHEFKMWFVKT